MDDKIRKLTEQEKEEWKLEQLDALIEYLIDLRERMMESEKANSKTKEVR